MYWNRCDAGSMTIERFIDSGLERLKGMLKSCVLCPRQCRVDRTGQGRGFCGLSAGVVVSRSLAHHGEEPPVSGTGGAGTIFLASCNLRCTFCQNYQISRRVTGEITDAEGMARIMMDLQEQGCHNIEAVTPTPHLPGFIEGFLLARLKGLTIPLIYNCGGYEDQDVIRELHGLVDIYLPDFKYGNPRDAYDCCGVYDYPAFALESSKKW
jgi:putative pyruvate formate lyase activating enzyme